MIKEYIDKFNFVIEQINQRKCCNCKTFFTIINNTLNCTDCGRWYCEKAECWIDCNDEFFNYQIRGQAGCALASTCDACCCYDDKVKNMKRVIKWVINFGKKSVFRENLKNVL
jgi:hypothetical protein